MAERRMFAKTIIDSDAFLEMPVSARLLYYDLGMRADDDGFVNSPKKIMKFVGASNDDMNILIMRKFIIPFDNGVVVIKHWRIHNYIRKDTYNETPYKEQKEMLEVDENNAYRLKERFHDVPVDDPSTQVRLGKVSIGKDSIGKVNNNIKDILSGRPDCVVEIIDYLNMTLGTAYKATSQKTISLIRARINEGFDVDDFKTVIDKKTHDWGGDKKMEKFLRPETLFGTKFEGYLNEPVRAKNASEEVDTWLYQSNSLQ